MDLYAQRIPKAILLMLVTGSLLGGAVGFASADGEDLPKTFAVAEPRIGDTWTYGAVLRYEDAEEIDSVKVALGYEYLDGRPFRDGDGVDHAVIPLRESFQWEDHQSAHETEYYVAHDGSVVGSRYHSNGTFLSRYSSTSIGDIELAQATQVDLDRERISYEATSPFCGYRNPWQSAEPVPLGEGTVFRGTCFGADDLDFMGFSSDMVFRPMEIGMLDGVETLRLQAEGEYGPAQIWLQRDIPYPVRIELNATVDMALWLDSRLMPEEGDAHIAYFDLQWVLTEFQPGTEGWDQPIPLRGDLPVAPIVQAPVRPWGPDDSGVDVPFTARQAYEGARTAPIYLDLRNYLASHPNAVAMEVVLAVERDQDTGLTSHAWTFFLSDGDEAFGFTATRTLQPEPVLALPVGSAGDQYETADFGATMMFVLTGADPDAVPDTLPTVASMLARYEALHGETGNTWGMQTVWWADGVAMEAGKSSRVRHIDQDSPTEERFTGEAHLLSIAADGRVLGTDHERMQGYTGTGTDMEPGNFEMPPQTFRGASLDAPIWDVPPGPVAASLGVLGLLTGIVYWFWPALKALPLFGLFSRVHGQQLLEHPTRAHLMATIESQPGVHYQALVNELGKGRGVVEHHLRKLESSGMLVCKQSRGYTCYYAKGRVQREVMDGLPAIKSATAADMLRIVSEEPGITAQQLVGRLGVTPSTASHHIKRMRDAGFIEAVGSRNIALMPTKLALDALAVRLT